MEPSLVQHIVLPDHLQAQITRPKITHLYVAGKPQALTLLRDLPDKGLGIVGTRSPQTRSVRYVRDCLQTLKNSGLVILSGMARGIDSAAHEAALDFGIPTVAILGSGLRNIYPPENRNLAHAIVEQGGLLLSEYPPHYQPNPRTFLFRNRIIAALSSAVWIVEASYRSGAINTARWSREFKKLTLATPSFPGDPSFVGTQALLDDKREEEVKPFWGPHSLGAQWISLSTLSISNSKKGKKEELKPSLSLFPDAFLLKKKIENMARTNGGCSVTEALNWALQNQWEPTRYFSALQDSLRLGWVKESQGVLIA